jgi:hypothetical protein
MAISGIITSRQLEAIRALFSSRSIAEAARNARVGERTLRRWMYEDSKFKEAVHKVEVELLEASLRQLIILQTSAIVVTNELMMHSENESIRLRSAQTILENVFCFYDHIKIEAKIAELEGLLRDVKEIRSRQI